MISFSHVEGGSFRLFAEKRENIRCAIIESEKYTNYKLIGWDKIEGPSTWLYPINSEKGMKREKVAKTQSNNDPFKVSENHNWENDIIWLQNNFFSSVFLSSFFCCCCEFFLMFDYYDDGKWMESNSGKSEWIIMRWFRLGEVFCFWGAFWDVFMNISDRIWRAALISEDFVRKFEFFGYLAL